MNEPPEKIDKYQIMSVLGKGAMGVVYHAYDPVVKRDVAIKLLSSFGQEETELISRFEREARLAGGLRHPNIVIVYDLGSFQGRPYICMEYIPGRDLQAVIKEKQPLNFEQRVDILLQICKGLDAAHHKGIIHRDIKPANIRIQDDNTVKIMDFGIARMGASQLTRSGYIIGTLQYMSPEQISGDQLDPRTDVFSTGVIGYELFTYNNPFAGEHTVDIMYRILNVRPQPLQDIPDEYGTELNQILMRSLEKNRELRYPSAREMAGELEEYLFYIKSLKFRKRSATPLPSYTEGMTQALPLDQMPSPTSSHLQNQIPAAKTQLNSPIQDSAQTQLSSPMQQNAAQTQMHSQQPAPSGQAPQHTATHNPPPPAPQEIPPTVVADNPNMPSFGMQTPVAERVPRTGLGANYSETGQLLLTESRGWRDKKFYILGAVLSLLFIGGLITTALISGGNKSSLTLASLPQGAEVWIDGQKTGQTPTTIEGKRDLKVVLRMSGYKEREVNIEEKNWPSELKIDLEPLSSSSQTGGQTGTPAITKTVRLETTPAGATIFLDGKESGKTPSAISLADAQPHQIRLQLEGFEPLEQTIDSSAGESLQLELKQLEPDPGTVRYTGNHPVTIYNGRQAIRGNPISLPPGEYTLTFRSSKKAFIRYTRKVEVKSGETITVPAPPTGSLTLKANPSNCKIYIDGEFVDTVPIFSLPVQAGNHVVKFAWETIGKQKEERVQVEQGQDVSLTAVPD